MLVAMPLGIGAAVYLAEYARPRVRKVIKPIIEILAGIPSVVLAYFAIAFINPNVVVKLFDSADRAFTMLAAGIAVGILTIPIIASVTEDALRAVPMSLREASFGLGAQRAQTTFRVVFPAGISGIVAALILGISRAIGETMVVAIAAGAVGGALFHVSPLEPGQTMTAAMAGLGFGSDQVAGNSSAFQSLFFIGALLFVMTLGLNILGDKLVNRVREVY
jgi:phosphate transport system permease protein